MGNWFVFYFFKLPTLNQKITRSVIDSYNSYKYFKIKCFLLFDWKQSNIFLNILELYNKNDENFGSNKNGEPFLISPTTQHQHFV
jgi:hypothetical protein